MLLGNNCVANELSKKASLIFALLIFAHSFGFWSLHVIFGTTQGFAG